MSATEAERIEAALNAVPWPAFVKGREWKLDYDWVGEKAIWIWIVVGDDEDVEENQPAWTALDEAIEAALKAHGVDLWPYIRVRGESDPSAVRR
jgi:hypothetical protein